MSDVIRVTFQSHVELVTEDFYSDRARGLRVNHRDYRETEGSLSYRATNEYLVGSDRRHAGCQWEMLV